MDTSKFFTSNKAPRQVAPTNHVALSHSTIIPTNRQQQQQQHFDSRQTQYNNNNKNNTINYNHQSSAPTTEYSNSSRGSTSESSISSHSGRTTPTTTTGSWSMQRLQTKPPPLDEQAASAAQQLLEELQRTRATHNTNINTTTSTSTTMSTTATTATTPTLQPHYDDRSPPAPHPPTHIRPPVENGLQRPTGLYADSMPPFGPLPGAHFQRPSGPDYAPKQSNFSEFMSKEEAYRSPLRNDNTDSSSNNNNNNNINNNLSNALQKRRLDANSSYENSRNDTTTGNDSNVYPTSLHNNNNNTNSTTKRNSHGRQRNPSDLKTSTTTTKGSTAKSVKRALDELSKQEEELLLNPYPSLEDITDITPSIYENVEPKGRFKNRKLRMNLVQASDNYPVLPRVCKIMHWRKCKETEDEDGKKEPIGDWTIAWRDTGAVSVTTVRENRKISI